MKSKVLTGKVLTDGRNQRIWELRIEQNYSENEIAREMGISQQRVSQILREWARDIEETPRQEQQRLRFEQVEKKISELDEMWHDETKPWALRTWAMTELRKWFDFRARLRAEYAPEQVHASGTDPDRVAYSLKIPAALLEALS